MNYKFLKHTSLLKVLCLLSAFFVLAAQSASAQKNDKDSLRYPLKENRLPYQQPSTYQGLQVPPPSNLTKTLEYDPVRNEYVFKEKIGQTDYRTPYTMNQKEYQQYQMKNSVRKNWNEKAKAERSSPTRTGGGLNLGVEALDKIFGTNTINIVPQGSAELIFGVNTSKIQNPNISERLRKTTTFDFQEKIQMNITGSIGDKMKVEVNYNTEASFDFENKTKLEYTGKEDEIIKKIEAGNVSLPLTGTLITGSQSLFGLKTELQFGKLYVTTVLSQQKGESSVVQVKGGAQETEFEVPIDQYDANKHFFLSHYFRDNYEKALANLPIINSEITITKIEVWVTNKANNLTDNRNVVAFLDLGEAGVYNTVTTFQATTNGLLIPRNQINGLYEFAATQNNARSLDDVKNRFAPYETNNFKLGQDYEKIEKARKLTDREFTFHPSLGYISLNFSLNSDEILAVAYEYTYQGNTYSVGELSTSGITSPDALVVKLIKGNNLTPRLPNWKLMMKNVYSINAYQINREKFQMHVMYQDDKKGTPINYIPEEQTKEDILLKILKLDNVNSQLDPYPDGTFDFIEGVTVNSSNGRIYFPTLEPFGKTLREFLQKKGVSQSAIKRYVFSELYDSTQTKARQVAEKNKFKLQGRYQSSGGSDIPLNALNVPQGSVVVTAAGRKLIENIDYTVDYTLGRVKILNTGLLESGTPIQISLESNSLFNFQTKTLIGTHLDYRFSDDFNIGATVMNLTERPLTQKVNIGDEPISNTIWGLNGTYTTKSQFLTTLVDKLPFLETKEPSSITIDGEFAQLIPGHAKTTDKTGAAYIDDFEGSETPIDLKTYSAWTLASTPNDPLLFPESTLPNSLNVGRNRAKLAWYVIDPIFTRMSSATPSNIKDDKKGRENHFVREVLEKEIFKNVDNATGIDTYLPILNLAFYPKERGPYNFDPKNVNDDGTLLNPQDRWGGIQRSLLTNDFEAANVEFIEFWVMDPFVYDNQHTNKGGSLYFDLGNVSEDVLKDSRKSFEQGLPTTDQVTDVDTTLWGRVPSKQAINKAFATDVNSRKFQDVGLDGFNSKEEESYFKTFLDSLALELNPGSPAYTKALTDPASDDFMYFRSGAYDQAGAGVLERYKKYNGLEGNSPALIDANSDYTPSSTSNPDDEDINDDYTLNESESFFQYKVDIRPDKLKVGTNYVVDKVSANPTNGDGTEVNWYQFRIPISEFQKSIGSIQDFKSIRFMRMYLKGFSDSVILRFARLELVRGEWRRYNLSFRPGGESITTPEDKDVSFEISSVNIEENSVKSPINYVLPPGVDRQVDPQNPQLTELNEQSMVLKVKDLNNGDARAAYKNTNLDIRQYRRLKMDVHAEEMVGTVLNDNELTLFIRLGSDYKNNFYEYEIPLKLTPTNLPYTSDNENYRYAVWPEENRIDIELEDFQRIKQARNDEMRNGSTSVKATSVYDYTIDGRKGIYHISGYPNLSNIKTIMIGVRYPHSSVNNGRPLSAEVWVNELRLTNFNEQGGWAANLRVSTKLADFGTLSVAGSTSKPGFGSIEKKVNERSKEEIYQYDVASNLELGKFFPEKSGIQIPMYIGVSETFINPQYNPLDPDVELKATLKNAKSEAERDSIRRIVQDYTIRKSLNFTNVRKNKMEGKPRIYDISNWTANYAYNETDAHNINIERSVDKRYSGGLMYNYTMRPTPIAPFQKVKLLNGKALRLIKDFNFNLIPSTLGFRTDMSRSYTETKLRNVNYPGVKMETSVDKDFFWNRFYDISFDLTRSIKLDFSATNVARIDEPQGIVNNDFKDEYKHWKDSVWSNIMNGGRTTHYNHDLRISYNVPINKLPFLDWTSANVNYNATYDWDVAPITRDTSLNIGNTIVNSGTLNTTGQLNLTSLYNKVPYFRRISQPPAKNQKKQTKKVKFETDKTNLRAGKPKGISHKLNTEDITVKVYAADGKEIKGTLKVVNEDKITFTSDSAYSDARVVVEGNVAERPSPITIVTDNVMRLILGVKNVSISWSSMKGSTMPGFMPKTKLMGMSGSSSNYAPGAAFVFGIQDRDFGQKAIDNNWLTTSTALNQPFTMTMSDNVSLRSTIEPVRGFRIELTANRTYTRTDNSYYDNASSSFRNPMRNGNFSMSFIAIGSAFESLGPATENYPIPVYTKFLKNRETIARRMGDRMAVLSEEDTNNKNDYNPNINVPADGGKNGYNLNSQEVLVPAFMAAYGNISPKKVTLNRFPSILKMMPNWKINFDGLSKIPAVQKFARSVSITHTYRATYNVGSYVSNPNYNLNEIEQMRDLQRNFLPELDFSSVSIREQFSPLIGIDITLKNSLSTKFEIKKERNVILSLTNNQLSESMSYEYVVGAGYKISDFKLLVKSAGGQNSFSSDLNLRANLSLRNNTMIIRRIYEKDAQGAQGQKVLTIQLSADYMLSDKFNLRMFYDRIVNTPFTSLSYATVNSNFGFSLRFSLTQ